VVRGLRDSSEGGYLNEEVKRCQAAAGTLRVTPSRFVVSLTRITSVSLAVSTHRPPLLSL
jgi:hypothetical protein